MDIRPTRRDATEDIFRDQVSPETDDGIDLDDKTSSGRRVLESKNDDLMVEKESPREGKYNLHPNPTPNFTEEYRY